MGSPSAKRYWFESSINKYSSSHVSSPSRDFMDDNLTTTRECEHPWHFLRVTRSWLRCWCPRIVIKMVLYRHQENNEKKKCRHDENTQTQMVFAHCFMWMCAWTWKSFNVKVCQRSVVDRWRWSWITIFMILHHHNVRKPCGLVWLIVDVISWAALA